MMEGTRRAILFTDIGDTVIDEGTEVRTATDGVVHRADCVPGAREALLALFARGFTVAMVADGLVQSFHNTMTQHGLDHVFAARAISEAVGAEKPDPRMFQSAMDQLGLTEADKARVVMLGNNLSRDIAGANAFGIRSALLRWSPRYRHVWESDLEKPDYVLDHPRELIALMERLERELGR